MDIRTSAYHFVIIIRPGVAGAILQTALSLTQSLIRRESIFNKPSVQNCKSYGAEILRECSQPPTCQVSGVQCNMSYVISHIIYVNIYIIFWQSGEVCQWMVCYQRGLPGLVYVSESYYLKVSTFIHFLKIVCFFKFGREIWLKSQVFKILVPVTGALISLLL